LCSSAADVQADEQYDGYSLCDGAAGQDSGDQLFQYEQICEHATASSGMACICSCAGTDRTLVFLLMITLMLYFLLQRLYRQSVPAKAPVKEHRVTAQQILQAFTSYTLLVHHTRLGREVQPTRLTTRQRELLQRLGFPTPAQLLSRILPRAPTQN
jgi:hypothetical protein